MNHPFRKLVNNENIFPGTHVILYNRPKARTPKQMEKTILDGINKQKKLRTLELKRVKI